MKRKVQLTENRSSDQQDSPGAWPQKFNGLNSSAPYFYCASTQNIPYFDLIYRESSVKSLIKAHSRDMYRLLEKVNFDGKYYRVKSVKSGDWEYAGTRQSKFNFMVRFRGWSFI